MTAVRLITAFAWVWGVIIFAATVACVADERKGDTVAWGILLGVPAWAWLVAYYWL